MNESTLSGIETRMEAYFDRLWPICRSILGPGYRQSLDIVSEIMPTERLKFPTGQKVFDWAVPKEWLARDAYLMDPNGRKRADFKRNNLHLVGYSAPFKGRLSLGELRAHLHSLPDLPKAVPYLTSYYKKSWGFCLSHEELLTLPDGEYEVFIDSELKDGHVEIGEAVLPGDTKDEVLFSSYLCHPSLANNELSGPLVLVFLYEKIRSMPRRRFTYRFALMPETIGSLCYLSLRGKHLKKRLAAGFQMTCLGGPSHLIYKKSRQGDSLADRAAAIMLRDQGMHEILDFDPSLGSDEQQYCSPGFDLPVGCLMRTMYGRYAEYHTSLDNKAFMTIASLKRTLEAYENLVHALESNRIWENTAPYGEPQLGKRGLYPTLGSQKTLEESLRGLLWLLNLADSTRDLLAIAERSGHPIKRLAETAERLSAAGLLKERGLMKFAEKKG